MKLHVKRWKRISDKSRGYRDIWKNMGIQNVTLTRHTSETIATIGNILLSGVFETQITDEYIEIMGFDMVNQITDQFGVTCPDYYHIRCYLL